MKGILWNRGGFTLTELLVAALFGGIVIATLYGFFRQQLFNLISQETKTATREEARGALDIMVRELRNAGSWATGTAPPGCSRFVVATATVVQIQADLDGQLVLGVPNCNSTTGEDVTYALVTVATSTCPGPRITRNGGCLVGNVVIPAGGNFLTYYDSAGAVLTPPVTDLDAIKRIKIAFSVQAANPNPMTQGANPNISSTLSSSVEFRN